MWTHFFTQTDDASEEVLDAYENEVRKWKQHYEANKDIYILATQFMDLYNHMLELEERAKDPSRLFNTRGGALLLEEKAKKKVRTVSIYEYFWRYSLIGFV